MEEKVVEAAPVAEAVTEEAEDNKEEAAVDQEAVAEAVSTTEDAADTAVAANNEEAPGKAITSYKIFTTF